MALSDANSVRKKHLSYYISFFAGGLVFIFLSLYFQGQKHNIWWDTLKAIGQAFIIGPSISLILDLPSMVNYFKKVTLESLVSEQYLSSLTRERLIDLRKKCTARIHLQDTQFIEQGLIDTDENICELLTKHYHERYRQTVSCRIDGDFVYKKHHIEEYIINPLGGNGNTVKIPEGMSNFLYKKPEENTSDLMRIIKYNVSIDDRDEIDYLKMGIQLKETPSDTTDMPYNSHINIVDKDNNLIEFEFNKCLKLEKVYEVRVPKTDITFLKRVKIPVKSFRLDYHFPVQGVKLFASCFGTMAFSEAGNMKIIHEEDHISVESYSWLLPGNGVFVVAV